ncbi:MAG: S-methyl-5'-thioadenosine phosphorylase [Candidatus Omnitrophota bacterium]|nr:MAG: S-methyl-5'-thioadenosine phosphorylase [Candidatus Omnitrophota bacterium]
MAGIGIIGGSGLYDIEGLTDIEKIRLDTPFGSPSDEFVRGKLEGKEIVFLPRHGKGHKILPSELNYRANIYGMKKLDVERIISVSAVGSLKEEIKPRDFLLPDQFVDRTNQARKTTFFGQGIVAHIGFAEPVCPVLSERLFQAGQKLGISIHPKGTYLNMEGPAFSTRAESNLYRSWGMDIIGMTNMPEARLAREAEICYVTLAMVTDYDCWRPAEETVSVDLIIQNMRKNIQNAKKLIKLAISGIPEGRDCLCANALRQAIVTSPEEITPEIKKRLDIIIGKYEL